MSRAVGPYSPVRRVGDWVITSGQVGVVTDRTGTATKVEGGTVPELRQALQNVAEVLAIEGATLPDVVKTTVFLADLDDFAAVNEVWVEFFADPEHRPTRSTVGVAGLPLGARVEVEAWAYAPVV